MLFKEYEFIENLNKSIEITKALNDTIISIFIPHSINEKNQLFGLLSFVLKYTLSHHDL